MIGVNYASNPHMNLGVETTYRHEYLAGFDEQVILNPYFRLDTEGGISFTYAIGGLTDSTSDFGVELVVGHSRASLTKT